MFEKFLRNQEVSKMTYLEFLEELRKVPVCWIVVDEKIRGMDCNGFYCPITAVATYFIEYGIFSPEEIEGATTLLNLEMSADLLTDAADRENSGYEKTRRDLLEATKAKRVE